ncbi:MAG: lasso peptide biosynthesis B2 protein [Gemmatimonadota bacterium]
MAGSRGRTSERHREPGLLIRAAVLTLAIRGGLALLPFRTVLRAVERRTERATRRAARRTSPRWRAEEIVRAVERVTRRLVRRNPCLPQALVGIILLRRAGVPASLRIGVAKDDAPSSLRAHAWVESDGRILIGDEVPLSDYTPLPPFGAAGRR